MSSEMEPPPPPISNAEAMSRLGDAIAHQWKRDSPPPPPPGSEPVPQPRSGAERVATFDLNHTMFRIDPSLERYNRLRTSYTNILDEDLNDNINNMLLKAYEKTKEIIKKNREYNSLSTTRGGSRRRRNTTSRSKKSRKSTRKSSRRHNKKSNRRYRKYRR
jgi:hypothetical protein